MLDKKFEFRGDVYHVHGNATYLPLSELTKLYIVYRALDGDQLAIDLLTASGVKVNRADGSLIWPPNEGSDNASS